VYYQGLPAAINSNLARIEAIYDAHHAFRLTWKPTGGEITFITSCIFRDILGVPIPAHEAEKLVQALKVPAPTPQRPC
jgi:hypothetical protein